MLKCSYHDGVDRYVATMPNYNNECMTLYNFVEKKEIDEKYFEIIKNKSLCNDVVCGNNFIIGKLMLFSTSLRENAAENANEVCNLFFESVCKMLSAVGKFVWYLQVYILIDGQDIVALYEGLHKVLTLIPHVRVLQLSLRVQIPSFGELKYLTKILSSNPLPMLQHLTMFKLLGRQMWTIT